MTPPATSPTLGRAGAASGVPNHPGGSVLGGGEAHLEGSFWGHSVHSSWMLFKQFEELVLFGLVWEHVV